MKNIKSNLRILFAVTVISMFLSCTKNFTSVNTDPNGTPNAYPQQLLGPALMNTLAANMYRNWNFNNQLMQVLVNETDGVGAVFRYDILDSWSDYLYNNWYLQLSNFKDVYKAGADSLTLNTSYMGISLICQAWVYSLLTDTYGDVAFSQSNLGRDSLVYAPKYDKQQDVYAGLFNYLEQADSLLKFGTAVSNADDPVFNGDVSKWRRFGNSLYLRLLLRISGKAEVADICKEKIQQIISDSADYPIMRNNDDAAVLRWTGAGPYVSPWYTNVRAQDFRNDAICNFFIDHLVTWQDPRIDAATYGTNGVNIWGIHTAGGEYNGVPSGYAPGHGEPMESYFWAIDQSDAEGNSPPANCLQSQPLTGILMNYSELQFILCECTVKGWISGSAESYYNNGVQAGITYWLPSWNESVTDYLKNANMLWDESASSDDKMEKIMLQKYYALFCTDMQQWFEYRRTGHPVLPKGDGLKNNGIMPARLKYPLYLQGTNPQAYQAAVADQGTDLISTDVWWQKP